MRIVIYSALVAAALTGCGSGKHEQTFAEGMDLACKAPDLVPEVPREQRIAAGLKKVEAQITNPDARTVLGSMASVDDKIGTMRAAVKRAGLSQCSLLDIWEHPAP